MANWLMSHRPRLAVRTARWDRRCCRCRKARKPRPDGVPGKGPHEGTTPIPDGHVQIDPLHVLARPYGPRGSGGRNAIQVCLSHPKRRWERASPRCPAKSGGRPV